MCVQINYKDLIDYKTHLDDFFKNSVLFEPADVNMSQKIRNKRREFYEFLIRHNLSYLLESPLEHEFTVREWECRKDLEQIFLYFDGFLQQCKYQIPENSNLENNFKCFDSKTKYFG